MRRIGWLLDQIQLHGESSEIIDELIRLSRDYSIMTPYTAFLADETTRLTRTDELRDRFSRTAGRDLDRDIAGADGQRHAMNRQELAYAQRPARAAAPGEGVFQTGWATKDSYEGRGRETVDAVRQVGNQALYRRGQNVWVTPATAEIELDSDDIEEIELGSERYFELVRANSATENMLLAGQQSGEELLVELRGQVYRIR